jgi:small-conductance mechanosensitive channel
MGARAWRDLVRSRQLSRRAVRQARIKTLVLVPLIVAVLMVYDRRYQLFGAEWDTLVRIVTAVALIALGWQLARDVGRAIGPTLFRRMDPATAGTVEFVIRLVAIVIVVVIALRIAGLGPRTLALGGAVTAVVVGLAAQQTIGNLIAGTILLSARPFRVGDRVRLQGGGLAGTVEGDVRALGLLYTTLANGDDLILVPNSVVLNVAVVPLREPAGVDMRARLRAGVTPVDVQRAIEEAITVPVRGSPRVMLEEFDADHVVVRIAATPVNPASGAQLATEVLDAIARYAVAGPSQEPTQTGSSSGRAERPAD